MLPVATATADISAKIVVPNSRIRSTSGIGTSPTVTGTRLVCRDGTSRLCAASGLTGRGPGASLGLERTAPPFEAVPPKGSPRHIRRHDRTPVLARATAAGTG